MSGAKQPHLNGAFYGPSIPPPQTHHRPGRRGAGRGCCCCGCLFSLLCYIVVAAVVALGVAALVIWLVLRPNHLKFHVTGASLSEFALSPTNNTLRYNLSLDISLRNPNRRIGVHYDRIEARAYYHDQRFDSVELSPFYQGHRRTDERTARFQGQNLLMLQNSDVSREYDSERISGIYSIDLKLYIRMRLRVGDVRSPKLKPRVECELRVPLSSVGNGGSPPGSRFQTTKCDLDW